MKKTFFKTLCLFVAAVFSLELICNPQSAQAQSMHLPSASAVLALSAEYTPLMVRGMTINPQDGLDLSFIVDTGNTDLTDEALKTESEKLIKYFLTALAVPEKDLWVNLSPYEKDRITSDALSQTEMGRDLLAQDYILKKITSSLLSPEDENGKKFWEKVYSKMYEGQGATDIPVDTFHKIWIMPESAEVFAQNDTVLILNSKLKVMLEEDYLAREQSELSSQRKLGPSVFQDESVKQIMRDVLLPIIEEEVNHGENFAELRQIFHSLILAKWFKDNLKQSLLGQVYADQSKLEGISTPEQKNIESIYNQYLDAFNAGSKGFIKEDYDSATQSMTARKYVTGGFKVGDDFVHNAMLTSLKGFNIAGALKLIGSTINIKTQAMADRFVNILNLAGLPRLAPYFGLMFSPAAIFSPAFSTVLWMTNDLRFAVSEFFKSATNNRAMMTESVKSLLKVLSLAAIWVMFLSPQNQEANDDVLRQPIIDLTDEVPNNAVDMEIIIFTKNSEPFIQRWQEHTQTLRSLQRDKVIQDRSGKLANLVADLETLEKTFLMHG